MRLLHSVFNSCLNAPNPSIEPMPTGKAVAAAHVTRYHTDALCAGRASTTIVLVCVSVLHLQVVGGYAAPLVDTARQQIGVTRSYDPSYRKLDYPAGDVPLETGVCTDVVIRAFRGLKIDLQREVHEDMKQAFGQYPRHWGLRRPDPNVDHRRVPNLLTYFTRRGWSVGPSKKAADFRPGDVVAWDLGSGVTHVGIISDARTAAGHHLVIHNIGSGAQEEDILFTYTIIGHYRPRISSEHGSRPTDVPLRR